MAHVLLESSGPSRVTGRCAVGHPHEPFAVDKKPVWKVDDAFPEALDELPLHVDLDDRVKVRLRTAVPGAAIENPDMFAIPVRLDGTHDTQFSPFELVPAVIH